MTTRGRIYARCLDASDADANVELRTDYGPGSCATGTRRNVELIAQARMIARINTEPALRLSLGMSDVSGSTTGVSPDIQWENVLPGTGGRRPDLFAYDSDALTPGSIYVGEVKQADNPVSGELTDEPEPYFGRTFSRAK